MTPLFYVALGIIVVGMLTVFYFSEELTRLPPKRRGSRSRQGRAGQRTTNQQYGNTGTQQKPG